MSDRLLESYYELEKQVLSLKKRNERLADTAEREIKKNKRLKEICGYCEHWITVPNQIPKPPPYCEFTRATATDRGIYTPWNYTCEKYVALKGEVNE